MASLKRTAAAIAAILVREGVDYAQSKAIFKAARERAGLRAAPEHRGAVDRLTVEEELRFLDQAYAQGGPIPTLGAARLRRRDGRRRSRC
jgi:integrase/recombinase XerD